MITDPSVPSLLIGISLSLSHYLLHTELFSEVPYVQRGNIYNQIKEPTKAIQDFSFAIALEPTYYLPYIKRAGNYFKENNIKMAIVDYTSAIKLTDPDDKMYLHRALLYIEDKQFDKALFDLEKALSINSENTDIYLTISNLYIDTNNKEEAWKWVNKGLEVDDNAMLYINRGSIKLENDDEEGGIEDLKKGLSINPDLIEGYHNLGYTYQKSGKNNEAIEAYSQAINKSN